VTSYKYNSENQLIKINGVSTGSSLASISFSYNALGRRIRKTVTSHPPSPKGFGRAGQSHDTGLNFPDSKTLRPSDSKTLNYVYDNDNIIAILDEKGNLISTLVHGPNIDEPLIMTKADGSAYFYHADALGSINYITNEKGEIVESYEYKTYGEPTIKYHPGGGCETSGAETSKDSSGVRNLEGYCIVKESSIDNPYMFTGREYDSETGLYFYRARYYNSDIGRFLQEDPIGFQGGDLNLYAYVRNNPVNYRDPFGLWYIDIGVSIGWFGFSGVGGVMISPEGIYKYSGAGGGLPGPGANITWSPNDVKTGWNIGVQGGAFMGFQHGESLFGEEKLAESFWEYGLVTPGLSFTEFYVEQMYKWPWKKLKAKSCKGY
ncbi:MAG: RHS repeat-associated core domain-containing protein, partial [Elusimicrobiota bacterium]|nr:RHS repeat-associated core domain-containing protein [Elusimicrobiota bacterium]